MYQLIEKIPQAKYLQYQDGKLYYYNSIDSDVLNEHSEFVLGSVTKIFTAILIMILHKLKILSVHDKINKYIKSEVDDLSTIKILDIVNHVAGLKCIPDKMKFGTYKNASDVCNTFIGEKLIVHRKGDFNYSNVGYLLLGKIIETTTGMDYLTAFQTFIFDKLDMCNTSYGFTNIKLYDDTYHELSQQHIHERNYSTTAGCLHSCIHDLHTFFQKFIKLLDPETIMLVKKLYFFKMHRKDNYVRLYHRGGIHGGSCIIDIKYNNELKIISYDIMLETAKFSHSQ